MSDGRVCAICREWKTAENFSKSSGKLFSYCKPCHRTKAREYQRKNRVPKETASRGRARAGEDIKAATSQGRTCLKCDTWKTAANFRVVKRSGNLWSYCHDCWNQHQVDKYAKRRRDPEFMASLARSNTRSKQRIKREVIEAYGGKCSCCGESTVEFLTLDHVNDDGAEHRRVTGIKTGHSTWSWARRNGFPDILQLLCWNCNSAKGAYGYCPHRI